jgi:hypothetical protein
MGPDLAVSIQDGIELIYYTLLLMLQARLVPGHAYGITAAAAFRQVVVKRAALHQLTIIIQCPDTSALKRPITCRPTAFQADIERTNN